MRALKAKEFLRNQVSRTIPTQRFEVGITQKFGDLWLKLAKPSTGTP